MISISGIDGLKPTLDLIKYSKNLAIVNKESLICGWNLINKDLKKYKTTVALNYAHSYIELESFKFMTTPSSELSLKYQPTRKLTLQNVGKYEYKKYFNSIDGVKTQDSESKNEVNAYHLFIISIKPNKWKINREELIVLLNEHGIGTSVHYIPVHMHSYYVNKYGYSENDFPNATHFSKNVISSVPHIQCLRLVVFRCTLV